MQLTPIERAILKNQYAILERVGGLESSETYRNWQLALDYGYEYEFDTILGLTRVDVFPEAEAEEVHQILTMFRAIDNAARSDPAVAALVEQRGEVLRFRGFDGNNERAFSYAQYLIRDCGLYDEQAGSDLNSHTPMLTRYRAMLVVFNEAERPYDLRVEDLERIVTAIDPRR